WRAKLMPRIRDSLVKQMDDGRRIGDFETVERHAQLLLELDPLSEDGVRGVMEARAWVGDRSNALKVYGRFETRLAEELGAKPSPDLVRIAGLLREGRRAAPRPTKAGQVSERHERRFEAEPLIGREGEFARLYDAWLGVRRREPHIVALLGHPGVGKTTLTNAFVSTCQMEGAAIARAQAYDAERELPFAVLAELVKQLTLQRAIGGADPEALSELTRVAPEVFTMFPGVPKPVEWAAEVIPLRLADGFLKAVQAATEESPLVLVVDIVHHEDERTFFRSGLDRLEETVSETQRNDLGRPFHGLRHAGEHGENLRRDARQFAQRLRVRSSNRPLQRELLHQLGEHGEGQFALCIVCLGTRNRRPLHLTGRHERVRESGLSHARIAEQSDDVRLAPSHPEPRVIQTRELALASDERFGLEAPFVTLRHLPGFR